MNSLKKPPTKLKLKAGLGRTPAQQLNRQKVPESSGTHSATSAYGPKSPLNSLAHGLHQSAVQGERKEHVDPEQGLGLLAELALPTLPTNASAAKEGALPPGKEASHSSGAPPPPAKHHPPSHAPGNGAPKNVAFLRGLDAFITPTAPGKQGEVAIPPLAIVVPQDMALKKALDAIPMPTVPKRPGGVTENAPVHKKHKPDSRGGTASVEETGCAASATMAAALPLPATVGAGVLYGGEQSADAEHMRPPHTAVHGLPNRAEHTALPLPAMVGAGVLYGGEQSADAEHMRPPHTAVHGHGQITVHGAEDRRGPPIIAGNGHGQSTVHGAVGRRGPPIVAEHGQRHSAMLAGLPISTEHGLPLAAESRTPGAAAPPTSATTAANRVHAGSPMEQNLLWPKESLRSIQGHVVCAAILDRHIKDLGSLRAAQRRFEQNTTRARDLARKLSRSLG